MILGWWLRGLGHPTPFFDDHVRFTPKADIS
jgi:hypothetical protein